MAREHMKSWQVGDVTVTRIVELWDFQDNINMTMPDATADEVIATVSQQCLGGRVFQVDRVWMHQTQRIRSDQMIRGSHDFQACSPSPMCTSSSSSSCSASTSAGSSWMSTRGTTFPLRNCLASLR